MNCKSSNKKSIAILAPYIGSINRGAETFVIEITKVLREYYDITVFSLSTSEEIAENIRVVSVKLGVLFRLHAFLYKGFKFYRYIIDKYYFFIPDIVFQNKFSKIVYKQYLSIGNYDLLYPNNGISGVNFAKKCKNTPIMYTGHGGIGTGERLILKSNIDMYVCLSKKQYEWACSFSNNLSLIHNGVCTPSKAYHKEKNKKIISVGALTQFKRHKLTIDAMSFLPDFSLTILGDGELKDELKRYAKKKLGNRCIIMNVPYSKVNQYYCDSDVFVLPSDSGEAFGIVYLEALSFNLPIVAPDDQLRREIIGNAGIFCDVCNAQEYAKSIEQAYNIEWNEIPYNQSLNFSWAKIGIQYKNLIDSILIRKD